MAHQLDLPRQPRNSGNKAPAGRIPVLADSTVDTLVHWSDLKNSLKGTSTERLNKVLSQLPETVQNTAQAKDVLDNLITAINAYRLDASDVGSWLSNMANGHNATLDIDSTTLPAAEINALGNTKLRKLLKEIQTLLLTIANEEARESDLDWVKWDAIKKANYIKKQRDEIEKEEWRVSTLENEISGEYREKLRKEEILTEAKNRAKTSELLAPPEAAQWVAEGTAAREAMATAGKATGLNAIPEYDRSHIHENSNVLRKGAAFLGDMYRRVAGAASAGLDNLDKNIRKVGQSVSTTIQYILDGVEDSATSKNVVLGYAAKAIGWPVRGIGWLANEFTYTVSALATDIPHLVGVIGEVVTHGAINLVKNTFIEGILGGALAGVSSKFAEKHRQAELARLEKTYLAGASNSVKEKYYAAKASLPRDAAAQLLRDLAKESDIVGKKQIEHQFHEKENNRVDFEANGKLAVMMDAVDAKHEERLKNSKILQWIDKTLISGSEITTKSGKPIEATGFARTVLRGFFVENTRAVDASTGAIKHHARFRPSLARGIRGILFFVNSHGDKLAATASVDQGDPRCYLTGAEVDSKCLTLIEKYRRDAVTRLEQSTEREKAVDLYKDTFLEDLRAELLRQAPYEYLCDECEDIFLKGAKDLANDADKNDRTQKAHGIYQSLESKLQSLNKATPQYQYAATYIAQLQHEIEQISVAERVDKVTRHIYRSTGVERGEGTAMFIEGVRRSGIGVIADIVGTRLFTTLARGAATMTVPWAAVKGGPLINAIASYTSEKAQEGRNWAGVMEILKSDPGFPAAITLLLKVRKSKLNGTQAPLTFLGKELPATIEAALDSNDNKAIWTWIEYTIRHQVTNSHGVQQMVEELQSLAFNPVKGDIYRNPHGRSSTVLGGTAQISTDLNDLTNPDNKGAPLIEVNRITAIISNIVEGFETGKIAGRQDIWGTAASKTEGQRILNVMRQKLRALEVHTDTDEKQARFQERVAMEQGAGWQSVKKGMTAGIVAAVKHDWLEAVQQIGARTLFNGWFMQHVDLPAEHAAVEYASQVANWVGSRFSTALGHTLSDVVTGAAGITEMPSRFVQGLMSNPLDTVSNAAHAMRHPVDSTRALFSGSHEAQEPARAETPAPVERPAPAETPAPVARPAPAETPAPVARPAPAETPAPVERPAPVETPAPERISAPVMTALRAAFATQQHAMVRADRNRGREGVLIDETDAVRGQANSAHNGTRADVFSRQRAGTLAGILEHAAAAQGIGSSRQGDTLSYGIEGNDFVISETRGSSTHTARVPVAQVIDRMGLTQAEVVALTGDDNATAIAPVRGARTNTARPTAPTAERVPRAPTTAPARTATREPARPTPTRPAPQQQNPNTNGQNPPAPRETPRPAVQPTARQPVRVEYLSPADHLSDADRARLPAEGRNRGAAMGVLVEQLRTQLGNDDIGLSVERGRTPDTLVIRSADNANDLPGQLATLEVRRNPTDGTLWVADGRFGDNTAPDTIRNRPLQDVLAELSSRTHHGEHRAEILSAVSGASRAVTAEMTARPDVIPNNIPVAQRTPAPIIESPTAPTTAREATNNQTFNTTTFEQGILNGLDADQNDFRAEDVAHLRVLGAPERASVIDTLNHTAEFSREFTITTPVANSSDVIELTHGDSHVRLKLAEYQGRYYAQVITGEAGNANGAFAGYRNGETRMQPIQIVLSRLAETVHIGDPVAPSTTPRAPVAAPEAVAERQNVRELSPSEITARNAAFIARVQALPHPGLDIVPAATRGTVTIYPAGNVHDPLAAVVLRQNRQGMVEAQALNVTTGTLRGIDIAAVNGPVETVMESLRTWAALSETERNTRIAARTGTTATRVAEAPRVAEVRAVPAPAPAEVAAHVATRTTQEPSVETNRFARERFIGEHAEQVENIEAIAARAHRAVSAAFGSTNFDITRSQVHPNALVLTHRSSRGGASSIEIFIAPNRTDNGDGHRDDIDVFVSGNSGPEAVRTGSFFDSIQSDLHGGLPRVITQLVANGLRYDSNQRAMVERNIESGMETEEQATAPAPAEAPADPSRWNRERFTAGTVDVALVRETVAALNGIPSVSQHFRLTVGRDGTVKVFDVNDRSRFVLLAARSNDAHNNEAIDSDDLDIMAISHSANSTDTAWNRIPENMHGTFAEVLGQMAQSLAPSTQDGTNVRTDIEQAFDAPGALEDDTAQRTVDRGRVAAVAGISTNISRPVILQHRDRAEPVVTTMTVIPDTDMRAVRERASNAIRDITNTDHQHPFRVYAVQSTANEFEMRSTTLREATARIRIVGENNGEVQAIIVSSSTGRDGTISDATPRDLNTIAHVIARHFTPAGSQIGDVPPVRTTPASEAPRATPAPEAPRATPASEAPRTTPAPEAPRATPASEAPRTTPAPEAPRQVADTETTRTGPAARVAGFAPVNVASLDPERTPDNARNVVNQRLRQVFENNTVGELLDDVREDVLGVNIEGVHDQLVALRMMDNGYSELHAEAEALADYMHNTTPGDVRLATLRNVTAEQIEAAVAECLDHGNNISGLELARKLNIPLDDEFLSSYRDTVAAQAIAAHLYNIAGYAGGLRVPAGQTHATIEQAIREGEARTNVSVSRHRDAYNTAQGHGSAAVQALYNYIADIDNDSRLAGQRSGDTVNLSRAVRLGETGSTANEQNLVAILNSIHPITDSSNPADVVAALERIRQNGEAHIARNPSRYPGHRVSTPIRAGNSIATTVADAQLEAIRIGLVRTFVVENNDPSHFEETLAQATAAPRTTATTTNIPTTLNDAERTALAAINNVFRTAASLEAVDHATLNNTRNEIANRVQTRLNNSESAGAEALLLPRMNALLLRQDIALRTTNAVQTRLRAQGIIVSAADLERDLLSHMTVGAAGGLLFEGPNPLSADLTAGAGGIGVMFRPFTIQSTDGKATISIAEFGGAVGASTEGLGAGVALNLVNLQYRVSNGVTIEAGAPIAFNPLTLSVGVGVYTSVRFAISNNWDGIVRGSMGAEVGAITSPSFGAMLGIEYNQRHAYEAARNRIIEQLHLMDPNDPTISVAYQRERLQALIDLSPTDDAAVRAAYHQMWDSAHTDAASEANPNGFSGAGIALGYVRDARGTVIGFGPYVEFTIGSHMVYRYSPDNPSQRAQLIHDRNHDLIERLRHAQTRTIGGQTIRGEARLRITQVGINEAGAMVRTARENTPVVRGTHAAEATTDNAADTNNTIRTFLHDVAGVNLEGNRLTIVNPNSSTQYRFISMVPGISVEARGTEAQLTMGSDVRSFNTIRRHVISGQSLTGGEHSNVELIVFLPDNMPEQELQQRLTEATLTPREFVAIDYTVDRQIRVSHQHPSTSAPSASAQADARPTEAPQTPLVPEAVLNTLIGEAVEATPNATDRALLDRVFHAFTDNQAQIVGFRNHANVVRANHTVNGSLDTVAYFRGLNNYVRHEMQRRLNSNEAFSSHMNWASVTTALMAAANVADIDEMTAVRQREEIEKRLNSVSRDPAPLFRDTAHFGQRLSAAVQQGAGQAMDEVHNHLPAGDLRVGPGTNAGTGLPGGRVVRVHAQMGPRDHRSTFRTTITSDSDSFKAVGRVEHALNATDIPASQRAFNREMYSQMITEEFARVKAAEFFASGLSAADRTHLETISNALTPEQRHALETLRTNHATAAELAAARQVVDTIDASERAFLNTMTTELTTLAQGMRQAAINGDTSFTYHGTPVAIHATIGYAIHAGGTTHESNIGNCGNVLIDADFTITPPGTVERREFTARGANDAIIINTNVQGRRTPGMNIILGLALGYRQTEETPPGHGNTPTGNPRIPRQPQNPGHGNVPTGSARPARN